MNHVTLRWLWNDHEDGSKRSLNWPKAGKGVQFFLPTCDQCKKGPPSRIDFVAFDKNGMYCVECLECSFKDLKRIDTETLANDWGR